MNRSVALLYLPGFPWHLEDAMPQRVLASCASNLACEGITPLVLDFGTPETLAALECGPAESPTPYSLHSDALAYDLAKLALARLQDTFQPDIVALQLERRKDVQPAREFARLAKVSGLKCPILLVGAYASSYGGLLVEHELAFDAAVTEDPELTLPAFSACHTDRDSWAEVPNLVFCRAGKRIRTRRELVNRLDRLAPPDYSARFYPAVADRQKLLLFDIEQTRGGNRSLLGPVAPWSVSPVRKKSPSVVAQEMDLIRTSNGGANAFHVSAPTADQESVEHLSYELRGRARTPFYSRHCSMELFDAVTPQALHASGCRTVSFDIPTGSQRLLEDFYGLNLGVSQIERNLHRCQHAQLHRVVNLTFPCPADDRHTSAETVRLVQRTMPETVNLAPPELRPESTWREWQQTYGFRVDDERYTLWAAGERGGAAWSAYGHQVPYGMTGCGVEDARRAYCGLVRAIHETSVPMGRTPKEALLAWMLDLDESPEEFGVMQRRVLDSSRTAATLIEAFNACAALPTNSMVFLPFVPELRAVGN
ncbi:MAG: hypothetical protein GC168_07810 [Candidatus Hydrogenedens sp.]|nr:hypothetical protein [Candidatus Hydrogenedens sp.]